MPSQASQRLQGLKGFLTVGASLLANDFREQGGLTGNRVSTEMAQKG